MCLATTPIMLINVSCFAEEDAVKRRHTKLLIELSLKTDIKDLDYEHFLTALKCLHGIDRGNIVQQKTFVDVLELMEKKGHLKPGFYTMLIDCLETAHMAELADIVKEAEKDIKMVGLTETIDVVLENRYILCK